MIFSNRVVLFSTFFAVFLQIFPFPEAHSAGFDISRSVVKIYTVTSRFNFHEPWQKGGIQLFQGSGAIISGGRILTNAHVVANHTFIQVRKAGEAAKYTARVESIGHHNDLAILRVDDPEFLNGIAPLELGELPAVRDRIAVYGYPEGGDTLSITEGVVSRIEHQKYIHSATSLLACQIDAPISSGNSGGPVIVNGRIVGVAFQGRYGSATENLGYMVPVPVITQFITDISDGKLDGIPEVGLSMQKMENSDLRQKFSVPEKTTGVLVNKVYPDSPAQGLIFPDDVILSIDGCPVENDGTIQFRPGERTFLGHVWQQKQIGERVSFNLLRAGRNITVLITLIKPTGFDRLVPKIFDNPPSFYINGGLVFSTLTLNYLEEYGTTERNWALQAPHKLVSYYQNDEPSETQREIILLINVLADDVNVGYHSFTNGIIVRVNGQNVSSLQDLIKAFESNQGRFHIIEDIYGYRIVMNKEKAQIRGQAILNRYLVPSDRSEGGDRSLQLKK